MTFKTQVVVEASVDDQCEWRSPPLLTVNQPTHFHISFHFKVKGKVNSVSCCKKSDGARTQRSVSAHTFQFSLHKLFVRSFAGYSIMHQCIKNLFFLKCRGSVGLIMTEAQTGFFNQRMGEQCLQTAPIWEDRALHSVSYFMKLIFHIRSEAETVNEAQRAEQDVRPSLVLLQSVLLWHRSVTDYSHLSFLLCCSLTWLYFTWGFPVYSSSYFYSVTNTRDTLLMNYVHRTLIVPHYCTLLCSCDTVLHIKILSHVRDENRMTLFSVVTLWKKLFASWHLWYFEYIW